MNLTTFEGYEVGDEHPLPVSMAAGSVPRVSSATLSTLASTAASQTALAANTSRKGVIAYNSDAYAVLLKYGATASASSFTVRIPSGGTWEMPEPVYTGIIDAIWEANGSGSLFLTEL